MGRREGVRASVARVMRPGESPLGQVVRRLAKNRGATAGGTLLVALVGMATFAPLVARYDPIRTNYADALVGPRLRHPLGTDHYGRDLFSRIVFGGRLSLTAGLLAVSIGVVTGVLVGVPSGYYGGMVDDLTMRVMDVMLAFPGILFAMAIVAILGSGLTNVMIAVGVSSIPGFVRLVRGSVLSAAGHVYVEAARSIGCRNRRIMGLHILPNVVAPLFTYASLRVSVAIVSVASLNFLGLGAQPPTPEWGVMLADGRDYMRQYWWLATFPGLAIMGTTLSINLFSNGLRDVLDPRLHRR
jgi:ABC-type dipeptide/oligopeptide/nickel transport system permease subunit